MAKRQVVIVGAGPGGLATAMQLAHAGCDVTILERRDHVGGRTSAIEIGDYRFDCGPTFSCIRGCSPRFFVHWVAR